MQNCYNTKKGQRGEAEDVDERLTTKHIQTLSFLQEIVNENKTLKARVAELEDEFGKCTRLHAIAEDAQQRIKDMQQQFMERSDEINRMLTAKHQEEMMKKVDENVESEKKWLEEKRKLLEEIERLKKENNDLLSQLASANQKHGKVDDLHKQLTKLQKEIETLKMEKQKLEKERGQQQLEVQRLQFVEEKNSNLICELDVAKHTVHELELRITRLESAASSEGLRQQDDVLTSLRVSLHKLHKEKAVWEEKERDYASLELDLRAEIEKLRRALTDSERMRGEMHEELDRIIAELNLLKNRTATTNTTEDSAAFREFVKVKRELVQCREENDELRARLKAAKRGHNGGGVVHLPHLDRDGGKSKISAKKETASWHLSRSSAAVLQ